jgi:hypothetical protein
MSKPSTCLATEGGGVDILTLDPWTALQIANQDENWSKHPDSTGIENCQRKEIFHNPSILHTVLNLCTEVEC